MSPRIDNLIELRISNLELKIAVQNIAKGFEIDTVDKNSLLDMIDLLIERRKVKDLYTTKKVDELLYAAAFIYDLYIDTNSISSILKLREKTIHIFEGAGVSDNIRDCIFEICEGYEGEDTKIVQFIPQKGSPHDLFADAIFINNLLKRNK